MDNNKLLKEQLAIIGDNLMVDRHDSVMTSILKILSWGLNSGFTAEERDSLCGILHPGNVVEYGCRMKKWGPNAPPYNTAIRIVNHMFHASNLEWITYNDCWGSAVEDHDIEMYLEMARDYIESKEEMKAYKGILLLFIVNKVIPEKKECRGYCKESLKGLEECAARLKTELGVRYLQNYCGLFFP